MPLVLILKFKKLMSLHDGNCHTRNRNPLSLAIDNFVRVRLAYNYIDPFQRMAKLIFQCFYELNEQFSNCTVK